MMLFDGDVRVAKLSNFYFVCLIQMPRAKSQKKTTRKKTVYEKPAVVSPRKFSINVEHSPMNDIQYFLGFSFVETFIYQYFKTKYNICSPPNGISWSKTKSGNYLIKGLNEVLSDLSKCTNRFFYIQLAFIFPPTGHANTVLIDRVKKTVERYEPYHSNKQVSNTYNADIFDDLMSILFKGYGYNYIRPLDYCPVNSGIQLKFDYNARQTYHHGLCKFFSMMYAEYRFAYPDVDRTKLISDLIDKLEKMDVETLTEYFRNYATQVQSSIMDALPEYRDVISKIGNTGWQDPSTNELYEKYGRRVLKSDIALVQQSKKLLLSLQLPHIEAMRDDFNTLPYVEVVDFADIIK